MKLVGQQTARRSWTGIGNGDMNRRKLTKAVDDSRRPGAPARHARIWMTDSVMERLRPPGHIAGL